MVEGAHVRSQPSFMRRVFCSRHSSPTEAAQKAARGKPKGNADRWNAGRATTTASLPAAAHAGAVANMHAVANVRAVANIHARANHPPRLLVDRAHAHAGHAAPTAIDTR